MAKKQVHWQPVAVDPPPLSNRQWYVFSIAGFVLLIAGILQLINFADFSDNFASLGITPPRLWAAIIILGELWGAASFFKLRLSYAFRMVSNFWALFVSLFWFYQNIRIVSMGSQTDFSGSNFFGHFLSQTPGWWTVLESTLLLTFVLYALSVSLSARK
ncbi:MAG TPA: hypothetical protein VMT23_03370 [Candidatus Binatia bacterium]|nr:hypothetical protein [Candidatus Binatia bacterium]